ncbi:MAG TPA: tryptophan--tRNA ligase [Ignavibacteria bacterium]|nr:tryptophan--tRNA ligase [Ignavibacteria bacterium]
MKRIVSGIKPTGELTIGNYLGAMKRWAEMEVENNESLYFVANLHAITVRQDSFELRKRTFDVVAWLLTCGVNPDKSLIFIQSMIPAHSEICWVLTNFVTIGELGKMTQFKDKVSKSSKDGQLAGLFEYPVLMAGDVLLYDADEVPVGDDQIQHLELTRNIANRFNNLYGQTFKEPKGTISKSTSRIMSLKNPDTKMSKSETEDSYIALQDKPDIIIKKFKRAVTDSDNTVKFDMEKKPAISNLLNIYSGFSGKSVDDIEKDYMNEGYGKFKTELGELVAGKLEIMQKKFSELREDEEQLMKVVLKGNAGANDIANKKVSEVFEKLGLVYHRY